MKTTKPIILLLLVNFSMHFLSVQAQDSNKSNLKYSYGYGVFYDSDSNEGGQKFSVGYAYNIWKERLRVAANFSLGNYEEINIRWVDGPYKYYSTYNFNINLNYDLIQINSVSLTTALGCFINNISGRSNSDPYRLREWNLGTYGGLGLRFMPQKWRVGIELIPLNIDYYSSKHFEIYSNAALIVKLQ